MFSFAKLRPSRCSTTSLISVLVSQSVAVCEVDLPGLFPAVLAAMHAATWCAKAAKALDGASQPTPRTLARLLKEVSPPARPEQAGALSGPSQ